MGEPLQRAEIGGDRDIDLGDLEKALGASDKRMSQAVARSTPAPMQPPWIAAITGARACSIAVKRPEANGCGEAAPRPPGPDRPHGGNCEPA